MKVTISVGGRFHAFYLAKYLQDKGYLHKLVTSYPSFEVKKYGIENNKISTVVSKEIIERGCYKLTGKYPSNIFMCNWYDKLAAYQMPMDSDIYIIWSGFALHTIRKIRKYNPKAIIILERGSAHIVEQAKLLVESETKVIIQKEMVAKEVAEYESVDIISTISLFAKKSFEMHNFPAQKIFVNNMGVDLREFPFYNRKIKTSQEPFVVGYVGVMSSQKNVKGLISATQKLVEKGFNIQLLLVGLVDNNSFDKNLLYQPFINYQGGQPQSKLHEFYKEMDLFVLNSLQDGFGMVILQAMSTGLAVIGTTNTGTPDVVKDNEQGFIIPINSDEILAEKIRFCYENREKCLEMGQNARKKVEKGFTWEDYGNRYVEYLKKLNIHTT
jgi:glycosyltransferase involved in cell wall biosynthesis